MILDQDRQMNKNDQLNSVLEKIQEIVQISANGDYLYRGEPECYDKVSSSLYRKHSDIEAENFDIEVVHKEILDAAKRYTTQTDDFEILTELQHYGGATNLIDFTTDYLIALFFACDGSDFLNEDGRVILLQKTRKINEQVKFPQNPINRVIAQKSIFVQPLRGFVEPDHVINIPKDLKQPILNHLQKYHNISTNTIYNDLHGFIRYQNVHQSAYAEFFAGLTSQNKKDYSKAIKHYSNAIKLNPQMAEAYCNRGLAYSKKGKVERAIKDYNKAIELDPNDVSTYNNRGNAYRRKGKVHLAIEDYNKAIDLNQDYVAAYNNRGIAYQDKGMFDRAIADYNKAIELDQNDAEVYNNRGNAYQKKGMFDRAIADYNRAIDLNPDYASAYNNRGIAYRTKGEIHLAIENLNKAIEIKPDYAEAYNNRGIAHFSTSAYDRAIADYNKAIKIKPDYIAAYNNRGNAYSRKGMFDRAIKDYNKALYLNPKLAVAYKNRGITYFDKGVYDRAIANHSKAIELDQEFAGAYYNRGKVWLRLRKWDNVRSDLTDAKSKGVDIIKAFCNDYQTVAEFEQKYDVKLPEDIAAMLTQEGTH